MQYWPSAEPMIDSTSAGDSLAEFDEFSHAAKARSRFSSSSICNCAGGTYLATNLGAWSALCRRRAASWDETSRKPSSNLPSSGRIRSLYKTVPRGVSIACGVSRSLQATSIGTAARVARSFKVWTRGLTFELRRERRCGAWPAGRMMDHSGKRAKCHAGASRLQRRVRRQR